ncbi:hypothetical protein BJ322DRAFT_1018834 [Thelephora terrestris]|uniref:Uncharacterized protein n=1 Tax=Thelephora terrestris TaxID=56493 RepID=A0A9P6HJ85_9AGAM|nr:hypothetical protein BJ322DRAFT_1018834 [Thelephora terrestris]
MGRQSLHPQLDGDTVSSINLPFRFVAVDMPIPDFPPPSFQEAITAPVYRMREITASETSFSSYHSIHSVQRSPSVESYPTTSASSPASQYEDAYEADAPDASHLLSSFPASDTGSPVGHSPAEWEVERQRGVPLEERVRRERDRKAQAETTHPSADPPKPTSRAEACSHCGTAPKSPADDRRKAETVPRRRGILRHRHSQSFSSASVPSTPIRSRPRTSLKSTSSSHRKSRSVSPRPSLATSMSTSNSLSLMSRKLFAQSNKGKDKSTADEPLESWEVLDTGPLPVPEVDIPQPPTSRVRRTLSRMSLSALAAINTQTDAGRNGSIEPYSLELPLPSAATEKSRLKRLETQVPTQTLPSSLQYDRSPAAFTLPPARASSPLTAKISSPSTDVPPPTPTMRMAASTSDISPTRPAVLINSRQTYTSPLISSPVAMRLGVRQRVKSISVHTGHPSTIAFPRVPIPADRRATTNSNLRKYASRTTDPSSPLSVLNSFPDVPPIKTHFEKPTKNRDVHISSLSTIRLPPSPLEPEPPTPVRHHYPGRPLPTPPAGVPPSPSAYESLLLPRPAASSRFALTLNVPNGMSDTMVTERSIATSSGLTYFTDRPTSPLSSVSGSSIIETINGTDGETLCSGSPDLDILISRFDSTGGTYQGAKGLVRQDHSAIPVTRRIPRLWARSRLKDAGSSKMGE